MRRSWIILGLLSGALAFAATGLANNGHSSPQNGKFGPYTVVTDDPGSCGNTWATDTEKRTFKIKRNRDGSYNLIRRDHGTFLTKDGQSPGACETRRPHGQAVTAGKHGKFHGWLRGTITAWRKPPRTARSPKVRTIQPGSSRPSNRTRAARLPS